MIGRLYGEIIKSYIYSDANPALYAFCGTGAFIGCINKTFAITIIVVETLKRLNLIYPMLVTTMIAFSITGALNISFFDIVINMRNLQYMPRMLSMEKVRMKIKDVCLPI